MEALIRRGISHLLGNEQSAKVGPESAWAKGFKAANGRDPSKEDVNAQKVLFQKDAIAALYEGSIGTRVSGPKADPLTGEMNSIAKREISDVLRTQGIKKFPAGDATVTLGGSSFTGDQLIERRLAKHGERIKREAEKVLSEKNKKAKAAAAAAAMAAEKGQVDAEALGL
jgi:hypothetical protein